VRDQLRQPRQIACDPMNFWIEGRRDALLKTLERVDILLINDAEARELSGEGNLVRAAAAIHSFGPKTVVIKRGEHGALMFNKSSVFAAPAFPLESPKDPTGAGDSFAGGFIGHISRTGDASEETMRQAIIYGSVMASFNVEDFSLDRLDRLTRDEIDGRYRAFSRLTRFTDIA
jgi:sugar/nucleoside kinase (ribokinase family)